MRLRKRRPRRSDRRRAIYIKIAHRGASGHEPENTIRAFEKAIELGADMVELDVHMSADRHVVVIHDRRIGGMPVSRMTLKRIKEFELDGGEGVPTLDEVVERIKGRCGLYIELKADGTPEAVVGIIRSHGITDDVIVGSFHPHLILEAKELAPEIRTSLLTGRTDADPVKLALESRADFVHLCWERYPGPHTLVTPGLRQRALENGIGIVLWHEERPEIIKEIRMMDGIYAVCSNNPELL